MLKQNRFLDDFTKADWLKGIARIGYVTGDLFVELFYGFRDKRVPIAQCCLFGSLLCCFVILGIDQKIFSLLKIQILYPESFINHNIYCCFVACSGFVGWTLVQLVQRRKITKRLGEAFLSSGLKNALGKLPAFICDRPIDSACRKLMLTRANLSFEKFKNAKAKLESALQIYIEEIKEDRASGTVEIIYAHEPMPEKTEFSTLANIGKCSFIVGHTRSSQLKVNLRKTHHILVAGQTGGGKSTFLRQMITTLYLRNKNFKFTLVDLKGGLEFSTFTGLKRVEVIPSLQRAVSKFCGIASELDQRMKLFGENKCKDLDAFLKIPLSKRKLPTGLSITTRINRHIVVIDEAAEIFLTSHGSNAKDTQQAKEAVSRISRIGRAMGVHLVIGTQRPDARALDTQIRANLSGKLCFQMADVHSSMVVLGNGRARDLPEIAGRGIWQEGLKMTEVQTPFLDVNTAEHLLSSAKEKAPKDSEKQASTDLQSDHKATDREGVQS